jgi:hypothetical protein
MLLRLGRDAVMGRFLQLASVVRGLQVQEDSDLMPLVGGAALPSK